MQVEIEIEIRVQKWSWGKVEEVWRVGALVVWGLSSASAKRAKRQVEENPAGNGLVDGGLHGECTSEDVGGGGGGGRFTSILNAVDFWGLKGGWGAGRCNYSFYLMKRLLRYTWF